MVKPLRLAVLLEPVRGSLVGSDVIPSACGCVVRLRRSACSTTPSSSLFASARVNDPPSRRLILGQVLIFLFCSGFIQAAFADTLYLKNGRSIEGLIKNETAEHIELDIGFGIVGFRKDEIERIYKSTPEEIQTLKRKWEVNKARSEEMGARSEEERNRLIAEWKEKKLKQEEAERLKLEFRPKQITVDKEKGYMVVDALLNKKVNVSLVVDTGASIVLLTNRVAKKLGVDVKRQGSPIQLQVADGRKVEARFIVLESIKIKDAEAKDVEAAILMDNSQQIGFNDGLLGMSYLRRFNFKFDYTNGKLILEKL